MIGRTTHYPPSAVGIPAAQLGSVAARYRRPGHRLIPTSPRWGPRRLRERPDARPIGDPKGPRTAALQRLEAVLFLAKEPLNTRKLAQYAGLADGTEARTLANRLNQLYDRSGRAFRIEEVAGGLQLRTRTVFGAWIRRLRHVPAEIRLSAPALETLAVVAYRQPVFRADVEAVRGVACGEILRQLMQRDLVRVDGRSEELGRPFLYGTTKMFLELFGLRSLDELPNKHCYSPTRQELGEDSQSGVQSCEEMPQILQEEGDRTVSVTTMQPGDLGQTSNGLSAPELGLRKPADSPASGPPQIASPRATDDDDEWEDGDEDEYEYYDDEDLDEDEDEDDQEWEDVEGDEEEDDDYEYEDDEDDEDDEDGEDGESEWEDVDEDDEEEDDYEYEDEDVDDEWEEVEDDDDEEFDGDDDEYDDEDGSWDDDEEDDEEDDDW